MRRPKGVGAVGFGRRRILADAAQENRPLLQGYDLREPPVELISAFRTLYDLHRKEYDGLMADPSLHQLFDFYLGQGLNPGQAARKALGWKRKTSGAAAVK